MATTAAKEWKQAIRKELTLPSGNVCLARPVSLDALIKSGKVPNTLLPMIQKAFAGKRPEAKDLNEMGQSEEAVIDMMRMFDTVIVDCVIEPKVTMPPDDADERSEDVLYADEVDILDKQFIFQWAVGGTSDVDKFREQSAQLLDSLQSGEGVVDATV